MSLATHVDIASASMHAVYMRGPSKEQPSGAHLRAVLARNLKALMERYEYNQVELARRSGVSQRHISGILLQRSSPTAGMIDRLAKAFGRSGYELQIDGLDSEIRASSGNLSSIVSAYVSDPDTRRFLDAAFDLSPSKKPR